MTDNPRLQQLLDELLDSQATPEEVCASCPEFLPEVRRQWAEIRRIQAELDALFPASSEHGTNAPALPPSDGALPEVPGYQLEGVLGQGGVGVVYRALHLRLHRPVALKMLARAHALPRERERFELEAEAVAALRHPNIVHIYDVGDVNGQPYFTMELVEGGSLAERNQGVPQPARQAAALVTTLAEAVHVAHQNGIVHRDLKPGNILLAPDGTPKITDFGLARRLDDGTRLTLSGALVGTPSYMAPEQARGDTEAIGPAADIYALGTILYELLTGRPPFRSDTASATLHQVANEEPVSPRRLNPRMPRDIETICLKCLHKEPHKRYGSAEALAEDLLHFQRGEPIKARPVGPVERATRWVRRRPALAGALASGVLLASALVVTVVWWYGQRAALEAAAVAYAEADLSESARLRDRGEFEASAAVLRRAKDRLGKYVPQELRDGLSTAFYNLELVTRLDAIRLERALVKPPTEVLDVLVMPANAVSRDGNGLPDETLRGREMIGDATIPRDRNGIPDETLTGRHYQEAFRDAGVGTPGDDPRKASAHVRASPVRRALVAALDDWAACATDRDQQAWVLAVVRQADPDSWRDRVRDPATWDNADALRDLAARAPVDEQTPQLLAVLGARLRAKRIDAVPLLARVAAAYPNDFWANIETGNALLHQSKAAEAAAYYRAALALRPGTVSIHYALGGMYLGLYRWDQSIAEYEQAIRLDPGNAWCHNRLGVALQWKGGHDDEAIAQFHKSIQIDPSIGWTHHHLAVSLELQGRFEEALEEFREAARLFPEKRAEWKRDLRRVMLRQGRSTEALAAWKEDLVARPTAYDDWYGYAELCLFLGDEAEYRRACRELLAEFGAATDPFVAERVGRGCLLLPGTEDQLRQAVVLTERAVDAEGPQYDWVRPYFHFAKGLACYRRGQFDDAIATMTGDASKAAEYLGPSPRLVTAMALYQKEQQDTARKLLAAAILSYDWSAEKATTCEAWIAHILRREAEALIVPDMPGESAWLNWQQGERRGTDLAFEELTALKQRLAQEKAYLEEEVRTDSFTEMVAVSAALRGVLNKVNIVAPTNSTVLICGESGTGKELIARALHNLSPQRQHSLVKLNCAAIPTGLLESELLGHEKGAFTGAISQKIGRFELAHKGTLFLDEVGEIPLELQPKLLRVLQEQEFERLGGTKTHKVDVRLVAATNRDLAQMLADGCFRSDLYYRLNVFPIALPPLRERSDAIPSLVRHFTQQFARRISKRIESIPKVTMDALVRYSWPGNVRELQNVIERAVILSPGATLEVPMADLKPVGQEAQAVMPVRLSDAEREHIIDALRETDWVLGGPKGAAARLGIKRSTLQHKMRKLSIRRPA